MQIIFHMFLCVVYCMFVACFACCRYISTHTPNKENLVDNTEKQLREKVKANRKYEHCLKYLPRQE